MKEELNATREDLHATKRELASTKREMARLRKAVEAAAACPNARDCPVLHKLRVNQEIGFDGVGDDTDGREPRHDDRCSEADAMGDDTEEPGGDSHIRGQPP